MQNYNWDLRTQFVFPEEFGIVEDVVSVDIKPRWQLIETEESLRLVGIYHITSTVRFDPKELPEYSEGTLIEHLEVNGDAGYFEYALPLEVNLPKERVPQGCVPEILVQDIHYNVNGGSSCVFSWDVCCAVLESTDETIEQEEEFVNFETYNRLPEAAPEIPSVSAFEELIHEPNSKKITFAEENEVPEFSQPVTADLLQDTEIESDDTIKDTVSLKEQTSYDESYNNYLETEKILQSANLINKHTEQEDLVTLSSQEIDQLGAFNQSVNLLQRAIEEELAFDDNDFFSELSESYTILDLKSNKVSPK